MKFILTQDDIGIFFARGLRALVVMIKGSGKFSIDGLAHRMFTNSCYIGT